MPKVLPQYTDDAKRRIVLAAIEVMAEGGYEKLTIDDVAKKIGVTKGAVYWYFRSKSALIQEVSITIENEIEKFSSDPYFKQFGNQELAIFDRFFLTVQNRKDLLSEIGLPVIPDDSIPVLTSESAHELISLLENGIMREQKNGHINSQTDAKTLALILTVLCSGIQIGEFYPILFLGRPKIQRIWYYAMKLFLNPAITPVSKRMKK
jgi:AcrR family transcriptional regulator